LKKVRTSMAVGLPFHISVRPNCPFSEKDGSRSRFFEGNAEFTDGPFTGHYSLSFTAVLPEDAELVAPLE
jgi:hypothetical protein